MRSEAIKVAVAEQTTVLSASRHIYAYNGIGDDGGGGDSGNIGGVEGIDEDIKSLINVNLCDDYQVQPIFIRKQPKFPTRERHLAIRRKKSSLMASTCCSSCSDSKCEK